MTIIPGQSLTAEPMNAPYERPPEISDPVDAANWHLNRLSEDDRQDAIVKLLDMDMSVEVIAQGILRGAVMEGIHSVDTSLIIGALIHEYIFHIGTVNNIDFIDFEENPEELRQEANANATSNRYRIRKRMQAMGDELVNEEVTSILTVGDTSDDMTAEEALGSKTGTSGVVASSPKGLMSRPSTNIDDDNEEGEVQ